MLLLGAMVLASFFSPPQDCLQPLRTSRLSIVNDEGQTVVEISGDKEGGRLFNLAGIESIRERFREAGVAFD